MNKKIVALAKKKLKWGMYKFDSGMILMFHHVSNTPTIVSSSCLISTENFMNVINNLGDVVSSEIMAECKPNEMKGKIVITFDDGLEDVYTIAYPILKKKNIPFTIFVVNDFLDTAGYITKEQLMEMAKDPLVTIGAHGMTHEVLTKMTSEQKWKEIGESKIGLEQIIEKSINVFAYSHGQYDHECLNMVAKAGYTVAFGVRELPINRFTLKWKMHLPRYNVVDQRLAEFEQARRRIFRYKR